MNDSRRIPFTWPKAIFLIACAVLLSWPVAALAQETAVSLGLPSDSGEVLSKVAGQTPGLMVAAWMAHRFASAVAVMSARFLETIEKIQRGGA